MINQKKNLLGVMQGRLLPKYQGRYQAHPKGYWQDEFLKAAELNLDCIEFILDYNDALMNPLLRSEGLDEIFQLTEKTKVRVKTVCADYFMEAPLHHKNEEIAFQSKIILKKLLLNGQRLGLSDIVIPCVDQSGLVDNKMAKRFVLNLSPFIEIAGKVGINIALETDLAPQPFAELLSRLDSELVTVNYDTGNSASLGFDTTEELACYGTRITDIHIKDRILGGGSVLLGTGDTQFKKFFDTLGTLNYQGPIIMQAYRDEEGVEIFKRQLSWLNEKFGYYLLRHEL
jgi:L-ribulose-5-phosphate 3-epimerase UlaE